MRQYKVYTDGSFWTDGLTHGGIIFAEPTGDNYISSIHVQTSVQDFVSMRNVGGEILAAWTAIWSVIESVKKQPEEQFVMDLYFDYEGVGKWLTGEWKAKKPATIWYRDSIAGMLSTVPNLKLNMHWVRGHAGNRLNELADRAATYIPNKRLHDASVCDMDKLLADLYKMK